LKGLFMAIGWLTILKSVPWTDVISNAPKVADGAKKLWKNVGRNRSGPGAEDAHPTTSPVNEQSIATRVATLETTITDLQAQMLASSELIAALAEQNTQLVKRLEINRRRVLWLSGVSAVLVIVAVIGVANPTQLF
jgi:hypothetical protein